MPVTKFNVKIRANKDNEMQLIKKTERKKILKPSDILMSNLTLNGFMIQSYIDKLNTLDNHFIKVKDKFLFLLPEKINEEEKTYIENHFFKKQKIRLNCYQPNLKNNKYKIQYNVDKNEFEFGTLNATKDNIVKTSLIEINDVAKDFINRLIDNKQKDYSFICYLNRSYTIEKEFLICDSEQQINEIKEYLKKGE